MAGGIQATVLPADAAILLHLAGKEKRSARFSAMHRKLDRGIRFDCADKRTVPAERPGNLKLSPDMLSILRNAYEGHSSINVPIIIVEAAVIRRT